MGGDAAFCQCYINLKTKFKNHEHVFSDRVNFENFSTKKEKYCWETINFGWSRILNYGDKRSLLNSKSKRKVSEKDQEKDSTVSDGQWQRKPRKDKYRLKTQGKGKEWDTLFFIFL